MFFLYYSKHSFRCQEAKWTMCKIAHIVFATMICPDCVKTHCDRFVNSIPFFEAFWKKHRLSRSTSAMFLASLFSFYSLSNGLTHKLPLTETYRYTPQYPYCTPCYGISRRSQQWMRNTARRCPPTRKTFVPEIIQISAFTCHFPDIFVNASCAVRILMLW